MTEPVVAQRSTVNTLGFANPINLPANVEEASHIAVYGDDVLLVFGVDYTVDGVGDLGDLDSIAGVNVYIDSDVILADLYETFTVEHDPPADQDTDLSAGGRLGLMYEKALDAIMRRVQSFLQNWSERSPHLPPSAAGVDMTLPHPEDRRGLVWVLDQDSGVFTLENTASDPDTEPLTTAVVQAAAAAASATAAAGSAATATAQAQAASNSADRAEDAAAEAGDLTALLNYLVPVGAYIMFAGAAAPTNYLACQGQAVSRTTYSALFAVIGTTYGAGNGSTTFNLPKFDDGRFMRPTGGNAAALGSLQTEMIGPHTHTVTVDSGGAHTHQVQISGSGSSSGQIQWGGSGNGGQKTTSSNGEHTHTATAANNSGTENRPRNSSVLVCIKY